jgi:predicted transcriptional regulator
MSNIVKNRLKREFSQIPNAIITDLNISANALRVYLYLISKPDNWLINNSDVMKQLGIKTNNSIAKYWKELFNSGWVIRNKIKDEKGRFLGYEYHLNDSPILPEKPDFSKNDNSDNPTSQKIVTRENAEVGKTRNLNNNISNNNKEFNKNTLSNRDREDLEKISFKK